MLSGPVFRDMCNRHVPHLIAEYEASKRDDDVEVDEPDDEEAQPTSDTPTVERKRLFPPLVVRLAP